MGSMLALWLCLRLGWTCGQIDQYAQTTSCEYHRVDIRHVLSGLLGRAGISFSYDRPASGEVSARIEGVPFEMAFDAVLESCHLTWRSGSGVIQIVHREPAREDSESLTSSGGPSPAVSALDEDASDLLWRVLTRSGKSFAIGPGLHAKITADIPSQSLGDTLTFIARTCHGSLSCRAGIWIVRGPFPAR